MKQTLPVHLNFIKKAKTGYEIEGKLPIKRLKRLSECLWSDQGELQAELKFNRARHIPFIDGHITTELQLKCQRCNKALHYPIDSYFKLGLVLNEAQMDDLPDEYEPYLVKEDNNHLADMLEDELLLALPLVARHEFDCSEYLENQETEQQDEVVEAEAKDNPFAALKDLL